MSLSPEREAELERAREFERNQWRIAEECGMPETEAQKVWDMVLLEMKFYCSDFVRGMAIASHARAWVDTCNPFHIDAAVYLCSLSGIVPPPALARLVADVARVRFEGKTKGGTAAQIRKDVARDYAFNLMANLYAAGATREQAARKVAQHLVDIGGGISFKASSLERTYPDEWRRFEIKQRARMAEQGNEALLAEWQRILAILPEANDELTGNRRD